MTKIDTTKFKQIASIHKRILEYLNGEGAYGGLEDIIIMLCDAYDEAMKEIEYLTQVARKAEEMANFYTGMPEKHVEFSNYQNMIEQYAANETNKIGYKAREFLSFLENGDE
jgi:hypothetical protein